MNTTLDRLRVLLVKDYKLEPDLLTPDAPLEALGIDSLGVAELMFNIEDEFEVAIPGDPVALATVGDVVRYIDGLVATQHPAAESAAVAPDLAVPACEASRGHRPRRRLAARQQRGRGVCECTGRPLRHPPSRRSLRQSTRRPLVASARFDGADNFEPPKLRMLDRVSQFALFAANQAVVEARIDLSQVDHSRAGVFVGTGMGGCHEQRRRLQDPVRRPVGPHQAVHGADGNAQCTRGMDRHRDAHGTGTPANDRVESDAIKTVFGERAYGIPISATKALHGHLLGATGALECVLSLMAMQRGVALPTMQPADSGSRV